MNVISCLFGAVVCLGIVLWAMTKLDSKGRSLKWLWFSLLSPWIPLIIAYFLSNKKSDG